MLNAQRMARQRRSVLDWLPQVRHCGPIVALLLVPLPIESAQPGTTPAGYPDPPQVLFDDLFVAVQTKAIFPDGKAFADAVPNAAPDEILTEYRASNPESPQALKRFVEAHFALPSEAIAAPSAPERVSITEHIDRLWNPLTRRTTSAPPYSSLLPLPRPYVVPGGRFREIYYWDSYFTMLGLVESNRRDLAENMVDDFAYLIDTYGHVPNGTRTYYLSRSQPPFFFEMVGSAGKRRSAGGVRSVFAATESRVRILDARSGGPATRDRAPPCRGARRRLDPQPLWDDRDTSAR